MNVLGIDVETTGLDTAKDEIIEIGAAVWSVEDKIPLEMYSSFIKPSKLPLSEEVKNVTGIKDQWLMDHGRNLAPALNEIDTLIGAFDCKFVVAHNGENFDKPLILAELKRHNFTGHPLETLPWLDTRHDLPFRREPDSRRLRHLALDEGFINPFEHRAVFDVLTMLKIMSFYEFQAIVESSKIPWCVVRALTDYDSRHLAKEGRFMWESCDGKHYPKMWVKKIKLNKVDDEKAKAAAKGFEVVRIA